MNKQVYTKPKCEVIELDSNTPMMAESTSIGFNPNPAEPDAPGIAASGVTCGRSQKNAVAARVDTPGEEM